jgi:hypothetical protein
MITAACRRLTLLSVPVVATVCLAGCGGNDGSSPSQGTASMSLEPDSGSNAAFQAARVIVVQIVVDTKRVSGDEIWPGVVNNGVVANTGALNTWYESGQTNLYLASGGPVTLGDEVAKAEASVRHLPHFQIAEDRKRKTATWTAEQVARVILVQYLVDAKDIPRTSVQGMTDASGAIVAGPALDTWFTAHQGDQLPGGGSSTLAREAALIARPSGALSAP